MKQHKGFTLMEILLVIGLLAVLAVVVFVALDPAKRFQDTRNARRTTDIQNILSAVHTYVNDTKGTFPAAITTTEKQIGTAATGCAISTGGCAVSGVADCINLTTPLAKYLDVYKRQGLILFGTECERKFPMKCTAKAFTLIETLLYIGIAGIVLRCV